MQITITHPAFQQQQLSVAAAGLFSSPRLWLNGAVLAGQKGSYTVQNDAGDSVVVRLQRIYPDPVPRVTIDGVAIEIARPLAWYSYTWAALPVLLLFSGGTFGILGNLLGGMIGVTATYLNLRILRKDDIAILRYWASLLVTLGAYIAFAIVITLMQALTAKS
jgi:hypothetical protein